MKREKTGKHGKVRVNRRWWVLAQPPYTLQGNEVVNKGETKGIDHPTRKRTKGDGIVKGWEDKGGHGRIPDRFT